MQNIGNFFVKSKGGTWTVHRQTGLVVNEELSHDANITGNTALMFDIDRWKKTHWPEEQWGLHMELGTTIDIMAIGLWYRDKQGNIQYEAPAV